MLVSRQWLGRFLPGLDEVTGLDDTLTNLGLEVEGSHRAAPELGKVVAGRVASWQNIAGTKLTLCVVDAGSHGERQIVCGAPNVRIGLRSALALPGATLPGGHVVQERVIQDRLSEGMLCSAKELGLGDEATTVIKLDKHALPGTPVDELLATGDTIYDLSVTPNRGDCLSMLGVAREIAAGANLRLKGPRLQTLPRSRSTYDGHEVAIDDEAKMHCPKFTCLPISGARADRPTPTHIAERLRRCGVRPVSVVVDITNYVMLELGQPLHAFDRDMIDGAVRVRMANDGEQLELLDGTNADLGARHLLVADQSRPLALAGVMGGMRSGVTARTRNILLEAAHFAPGIVRGRTRELNIASEAAFRFERGVDPDMCEIAITRAARLITIHCGGSCGRLNVAGSSPDPAPPVALPYDKVEKITGVKVGPTEANRRLKRLGFAVRRDRDTAHVEVPSWRFDVALAEDLVEEVVRLGGYDSVPTTMPQMDGGFTPQPENLLDARSARDRLTAIGYNEIVTYAFVNPAWERDLYGNDSPHALSNPLAPETSVMRSGLLGGLVDRAVHNRHRHQDHALLFEIGRCFPQGDEQPQKVAGICWGAVRPDHWDRRRRDHDFYDAKAAVEALAPGAGLRFEPGAAHVPAMRPGRCASVLVGDDAIGVVGELHPALLGKRRYDLDPAPAAFELDLDQLSAMARGRRASPVPKFPLVRRDLALTVADGVPAGSLLKSAQELGVREVSDIVVFDSFTSDRLGTGLKSVGIRVTMQGESENLDEGRISAIVARITAALEKGHGARVRKQG